MRRSAASGGVLKDSRAGLAMLALVGLAVLAGIGAGWLMKPREGEAVLVAPAPANAGKDYLRAVYDPLHFKPAIDSARDEQCLACHQEVLDDRVRSTSPAGIRAGAGKAWYQQLSSYAGEQDTFHRRHLVTPLARELMALSCNACHQGHDPREEAPGSSATSQGKAAFPLRKQVDVEKTCLKCHGRLNSQVMGLPGPWLQHKAGFGNSCLTCHGAIRTRRHQVSYLKAEAIEAAGKRDSDTCYGCHGGRSWYRLAYPYPRHAWEGMPAEVPAWAKDRPTESEARFRLEN